MPRVPRGITVQDVISKIKSGDYVFENVEFTVRSATGSPPAGPFIDFVELFERYYAGSQDDKIEIKFNNCNFEIDAYFKNSKRLTKLFYGDFSNVTFQKSTYFWNSKLNLIEPGGANLIQVRNDHGVPDGHIFNNNRFNNVIFSDISFNTSYIFRKDNVFAGNVKFVRCSFDQGLVIKNVLFEEDCNIFACTFKSDVHIDRTTFKGNLIFEKPKHDDGTQFNDRVFFYPEVYASLLFSEVVFNEEFVFRPSIVGERLLEFRKTEFKKAAIFRYLNLANAIFQSCDLTNCSFMFSNVVGMQLSNCEFDFSRRLLDERILKDSDFAKKISVVVARELAEINVNDVLNEYRMFEICMDTMKDFVTGGEFHKRRYELQRTSENNRLTKCILWLYKLFSNYGEDYGRSLAWLFGALLGFSVIYLFTGLKYGESTIYYGNPLNMYCLINDWGCSLLYSLSSSVPFRRENDFVRSANNWTTAFSVSQTLLQTVIGTLFVIALRRKFKR